MAVEDHPRFAEWEAAFDRLREARERHQDALGRGLPGIDAYKLDLHKAQEAYDQIRSEIGDA